MSSLGIKTNAQNGCGTTFDTKQQRLMLNAPFTSVDYTIVGGVKKPTESHVIHIQFHVLCEGNISTAPTTTADINSAVAVLNNTFNLTGLSFVQCREPEYITNCGNKAITFGYPNRVAEENNIGKHDLAKTINIYIALTLYSAPPPFESPGGYTYFLANTNRIFMATAWFPWGDPSDNLHIEDGTELSHQMAHFFGLMHTFGPGYVGSGTTELVNGSNSATAGDFIQDTPAEPGNNNYDAGGALYGNCAYPYQLPANPCSPPPGYSTFCDANGQVYQPMANNLMLYNQCPTRTALTAKQIQKINGTYLTYFQNKFTGGVDLVSKDHPDDLGFEPTPSNDWIWIFKSPDIWNCRNPNTCTDHQEPGYQNNATTNNYLRVKVKNNGCITSGPAVLHTYWTLGSTGETWPASWTTQNLCGLPGGREIPNADNTLGQAIPALQPGAETIITFPWKPIDPNPYTCIPLLSNGDKDLTICVLSRIESTQDPMFSELNGPIDHNVRYNNNIVTRNTKLVNLTGSKPGRNFSGIGSLLIQNAYLSDAIFDLHIQGSPGSDSYFEHGSLIVSLSDELWDAWINNGQKSIHAQVWDESAHEIVVTGSDAVLQNVPMTGNILAKASCEFFLNEAISDNLEYSFSFYQSLTGKEEIAGSACIFDVNIAADEIISAKPGISNILSSKSSITLYPNPVQQNRIALQLKVPSQDIIDLGITDITGKVILSIYKGKVYEKGVYTEHIDLSTYANGLYFLKAKTNSGIQTIKFSIIK